MLAVIDTNIWVSAVLKPDRFCAPFVDALVDELFTSVVCSETMAELTQVLTRPALLRRYPLSGATVANIVRLTGGRSLWVDELKIVPVCRDPRDDMFIALAVASKAEYLVTRDDDLKEDPVVRDYLAPFGCEVVPVREFLQIIKS